jgi:multidrug efflux pump subunit AcrB
MNIGEYSVKNRVVSWLLVIVLLAGGYSGFMKIGKLEDPAFRDEIDFNIYNFSISCT